MKAGHVHGTTDRIAAYPTSEAVHPAELVATVYHLPGIDPQMLVHDRLGRSCHIARGYDPIEGILL